MAFRITEQQIEAPSWNDGVDRAIAGEAEPKGVFCTSKLAGSQQSGFGPAWISIASGTMSIEYRLVSLLPTCLGNERIRIAGDGRVSYSRNTAECDEGTMWSAPWRDVGWLDDAALLRLREQITGTGLLELPSESIDEAAQGSRREEIDLTIDQRKYRFVVQNAEAPPFRTVVKLLWAMIFELDR